MSKSSRRLTTKKAFRKLLLLSPIVIFFLLILQTIPLEPETASDKPKVDIFPHETIRTRSEDCASCHYQINQTLASGKHSSFGCWTCHDPDRKSELVIVLECTGCHTNLEHDYEYPECMNCHDEHAAGFRHDIDNHFCQDCHSNETVALDMGSHNWQECISCHPDHTLDSIECNMCHGIKHSDLREGGYVYPECLDCHSPMNATFRHNITDDLCQDCHSSEFWRLQTGGHSGGNCTDCHGEHSMITADCESCHGTEHGYTYPKCLECHEPMQATPGSPEYSLSDDIVIFALIAIIVSISLSVAMVVFRKKDEGKNNG